MATVDEEQLTIIFDDQERIAAWNKAPKLTNLDPEQFRLCYLCKLPIDRNLELSQTNAQNQSLGWIIDLINAKSLDLDLDNLVVIHFGCLSRRTKKDQTKIFNKVSALLWKYNE